MTANESILFISAVSPPITGVTTASNAILSHLRGRGYIVYLIDYSRKSLISGKFSWKQVGNVLVAAWGIVRAKRKVACVYLANSSSFWGNMRDMFFLFLLGKEKRKSLVLHLHTATFAAYVSASPWWVRYLNRRMLKDTKAAIVVGETFVRSFENLISSEKVKVVKNCAKADLLIPESVLVRKYSHIKTINILYLGNLLLSKGYQMLLEAYLSLPSKMRENTTLHFAGSFRDDRLQEAFLDKIAGESDIFYHGVVQGDEKRELLWNSHIFCLPSGYPPEAQPISILEAYAAGCIVVATNAGGIGDILRQAVNGYLIPMGDTAALKNCLESLILSIEEHKGIAFRNHQEAMEEYTETRFNREVEEILLSCNV
jgi:glycosyltransferase involved in cell wall biosynthesis